MLEEHREKQPAHDFDGINENRETSPPVYFTILFYGLIIWGVAFSAFYLLSGWSSDAEFQTKMQAHQDQHQAAAAVPADKPATEVPPKAAETSPAAVAAAGSDAGAPDAKAIYAAKCAMCHGADGKGGFGPDLTAADYEYGKNRQAIFQSVAEGRGNNKMPAFEGQLKREEIYALADYILSL